MISQLAPAILPMALFSLTTSILPGPVNFIALSLGSQNRKRQAFAFVSGATIGFTILLALLGLGMDQILTHYQSLLIVFNSLGSLFIAYLGYKIFTSQNPINTNNSTNIMGGFFHGFVLQWLNPKAWGSCLAGHAAFQTSNAPQLLALFIAIYLIVCFIGVGSWAIVGTQISHYLSNKRSLRRFNHIMGSALILLALFLMMQPHIQ
ncbi:MAG: LysE family translocator [Cohaesibacter sp.]|nr:LysE family translocator [Cohaesibacter sp.]